MDYVKQIVDNIDILFILFVLLGGLFSKKYLADVNIKVVYKTLIVSTVFASLYVFAKWFTGYPIKQDIVKYLFSYTVGTSLYELLLQKAMDRLAKLLP